MVRSEIEKKVKEVIVAEVGASANEISMDTSLKTGVPIDSYSALQILFELEEAFSITIPDEAIKQAEFPRDIVDYVEKRLQQSGPSSASTGGPA